MNFWFMGKQSHGFQVVYLSFVCSLIDYFLIPLRSIWIPMHTEDRHTYQAPQKNEVTQAFFRVRRDDIKVIHWCSFYITVNIVRHSVRKLQSFIPPFRSGISDRQHRGTFAVGNHFWSILVGDNLWCCKYLTVIVQKRVQNHSILSWRGRMPSWLKLGVSLRTVLITQW